MTHEGRMTRGKFNFDNRILLDNEDTKYFLEHSKALPKEETKEEIKEEKPKKKKRSK
jgi:hypothetical protein